MGGGRRAVSERLADCPMKHWSESRIVFDRLETSVRAGRRATLVTVTDVRGSAYRRPGAKLLVADDGSTIGNVSGGCLEADAREVALQVMRSGVAQRRTYCSTGDQEPVWGLGLGCDGEVDLFFEPAAESRAIEQAFLRAHTPFVTCSVLAGPPDASDQRLIVSAASAAGTFGSRQVEPLVITRARALLRERGCPVVESHGGRTIFFEPFLPPPHLVICGAGDDAVPLASYALDIGFRVTVVDRRPALVARQRFRSEVTCVLSDGNAVLNHVSLDENGVAVVMTHNLASDVGYVEQLLTTPVPYIGILGSRQRVQRVLAVFAAHPSSTVIRDRVYGPVGLDIGADGAEQVAIAILSEILAVRSGRDSRPLRERTRPIHTSVGA